MKIKLPVSMICAFGLLAAGLVGPVPAANATSWSSFEPASFADVYLGPQLATDQLDYVLSMGPSPKITIGPATYDVNWVQAFYVVSQDRETGFRATNGTTVHDWTWDAKDSPGQIAGWRGTGQNRLYPGGQKMLGFGELDITGNAVLTGLHVGYKTGSKEETGYYKGAPSEPSPVPEPGSLIALATGLFGSVWVLRRRTDPSL